MNKKEIIKEMCDIQTRYSKPLLKKNYTDKDYIIENYENLVLKIAKSQDAVFTKEEAENLLKQLQEIDKCDIALTSSLMSKRIHLENELLKKKIAQLETNRDEAYKLLDDIDEYMLVEQHLKLVEAKKLLERGNSNE